MTAHTYRIARGTFWAIVVAFSKAHARRLLLEGVEAIRATDGQLECCGILDMRRTR